MADEKKPWLKSYRLGPYKLASSLEPYPVEPLYAILDRTADRYPRTTAIDYCGRRFSYAELRESVNRLARALASLGIQKGERVATILPSSPQYIIANFAILKAGAVHVPCSILHKERELEYEIGESEAVAVICLDDLLERVRKIKPQTDLQYLIVTSFSDFTLQEQDQISISQDTLSFRKLIASHESDPPLVDLDPLNDLASLAFTGGSTGIPKGVMLTHFNRYANTRQAMPWVMEKLEKSIRGKASLCIAVPLFHAYGESCMLFGVYWGLRMILVPDPRDIDLIAALLKENRPFMAALVPTQLMKLQDCELARMPIQILSGASHLPAKVREGIAEKIKMPVSEGYGLTETSAVTHLDLTGFTKITGFSARQKYSIGLPVPNTEVKLVDEDSGKECPPGETGHMYVKGPQLMKGYWPEAGGGLVDGWLPTGDIARMDEDGYFYLVDRIKDMANISGYKVYTSTIDDVLYQHPAVSVVAVIGLPDPEREGSERLKAFVVLKENFQGKVTAEELIAFCRDNCAPYAVPRLIEFRDVLPYTVTEKIFKRRLREEELKKLPD